MVTEQQLLKKLRASAELLSNRELKLIMRQSLHRESRQLAYGILVNRNAFNHKSKR